MYGFPVVPVETGGLPGLFTSSETGFGRFLRGRRIGRSGSRIRRLGDGWCRGGGRRRSGEQLFFPLSLTPSTDQSVCLDDRRQQQRDYEEVRVGLEVAEGPGELYPGAAEGVDLRWVRVDRVEHSGAVRSRPVEGDHRRR